MNYQIAIPSYKRANKLTKCTLATLHKYQIDKSLITIFVVEGELNDYKNSCKGYNVVAGKLGLVRQREFIDNYYPSGTYIVSLDDDIRDIDLTMTDFNLLDDFFRFAF